MKRTYGYARVSSRDQNEARQLIALHEMGVESNNIYVDKQSGKDFDRPMYKSLIRRLKENDILYVKSIDRLGRNYEDIIEQWKLITKEILDEFHRCGADVWGTGVERLLSCNPDIPMLGLMVQ